MSIRGTIEGANCKDCPFAYNGSPAKPVFGEGPESPSILVIGESPGQNEVRMGKPFVGKSGRLLDRILKVAGAPRETVYTTNAILCIPFHGASDKVKAKAARCCKPRLAKEISQFPGKPVLALGYHSAQSLAPSKFSISDRAGTYSLSNIDGTGDRYIIPSLHPAFILHSEGDQDLQFYSIVYDAAKVVRLATGEIDVEEPKFEIEKESVERATELVRGILTEAKESGFLGLDTETTGRARKVVDINGNTIEHTHDAREAGYADINAIGLATEERAVCVPWDLMSVESKELLKEYLIDPSMTVVMHNSLYDRPVLHWNGFEVKADIIDTMLWHHAAFPGLSHKLQRVASQFFVLGSWKSEYRSKKEQDLGEHLKYCSMATLFTAKLRSPLLKSIQGKAERVAAVDKRMAEIAFKMHVRGIPICREANRALGEQLKPAIAEKSGRLMRFFDDPGRKEMFIGRLALEMAKVQRDSKSWTDPEKYEERVELRKEEISEKFEKGKFKFSPGYFQHVSSYLLACGIPLRKLTEKGGISTDKEVLEGFGHIEEVRDILDYRSVKMLHGTFVEPMSLFMDEHDHIHPNWRVSKNTGRWSSDRPQVMNWTKGDPEEGIPNIRSQVVALPGWVFIGADYDKFEAKIIGWYSQDPYLLSSFREKRDIHSEIAAMTLPGFSELEGMRRERARDLIKNFEYAFFYKAAPATAHSTVRSDKHYSHVKLQDVIEIFKVLQRQFKGVMSWHNELLKEVVQKRELVVPIDGRRWLFPMGLTDPNLAVNWRVQATAGSICNQGVDVLDRRLDNEFGEDNAHLLIQLHDAVYIAAREEVAEKAAKTLEESLYQVHTFNGRTMEFTAKAKIGKVWSDIS